MTLLMSWLLSLYWPEGILLGSMVDFRRTLRRFGCRRRQRGAVRRDHGAARRRAGARARKRDQRFSRRQQPPHARYSLHAQGGHRLRHRRRTTKKNFGRIFRQVTGGETNEASGPFDDSRLGRAGRLDARQRRALAKTAARHAAPGAEQSLHARRRQGDDERLLRHGFEARRRDRLRIRSA